MDKIGKSGNFKEVYFFSVSAPEYKEIIIIIVLFPPIYEKIYLISKSAVRWAIYSKA